MSTIASHATIIPTLRYRRAKKAISWLCRAFGFKQHLVVEDKAGKITHAQLTIGHGMIMLGSVRDDELDALQKPPAATEGLVTQSPYVVVQDVEAHYAQALANGAEIIVELREEDYGGHFYSCRDAEGHLWNFGSYNPWAPPYEREN